MSVDKKIIIEDIFNYCVYVLEVIGDITGMGYFLANIVIFVIIQPLLILLFFILWRYERNKNRRRH
jgi:uncharacterized membrane protein